MASDESVALSPSSSTALNSPPPTLNLRSPINTDKYPAEESVGNVGSVDGERADASLSDAGYSPRFRYGR